MDDLRQLAPERTRDPLLHTLIRTMIRPSDDVGYPERKIIDDARQLIGGGAIRSDKGDAVEAHRAVFVAYGTGLERTRCGLGVAAALLTLTYRPLIPANAEPAKVAEDACLPFLGSAARIGVVDSQDEHTPMGISKFAVCHRGERVAEVE